MEWKVTTGLTPYADAMAHMEARQRAVQSGEAVELIWLLEHPPLYTAGTSAKAQDLLSAQGFEVHQVGRGGQYTYHGPGQRVVYLVLDLSKRGRDVRAYVKQLEQWIIDALGEFDIQSFTREGRVGVWVEVPINPGQQAGPAKNIILPNSESKIAALGVRIQKWVTTHGIAINLNPDLSHYSGIVPCGLAQFGVTSLHDLGLRQTSMANLDAALQRHCPFYTEAEQCTAPMDNSENV